MASGNFLIGRNLSLEGFNKYVQPLLQKKGYSVKDKLSVPYEEQTILVSIVGKGDLEKEINNTLIESGKLIIKTESDRPDKQEAWSHQVSGVDYEKKGKEKVSVRVDKGVYETVGTYQDDNTASQLFSSIAQGYLLEGIRKKAEEVVEEVKGLLDQRLADLG